MREAWVNRRVYEVLKTGHGVVRLKCKLEEKRHRFESFVTAWVGNTVESKVYVGRQQSTDVHWRCAGGTSENRQFAIGGLFPLKQHASGMINLLLVGTK